MKGNFGDTSLLGSPTTVGCGSAFINGGIIETGETAPCKAGVFGSLHETGRSSEGFPVGSGLPSLETAEPGAMTATTTGSKTRFCFAGEPWSRLSSASSVECCADG